MTKRISTAAALMLWAATAATAVSAQQAAKPCLTSAEGAGLLLFIAPEVINAAAEKCRATLPDTALLRRPGSAVVDRYRAEAAASWPMAKAAIVKLSDGKAAGLIGNDAMRPLIAAGAAGEFTKSFKTTDCAAIDNLLTTMEPLPPRGVAAMLIAIVQMTDRDKRNSSLPICPLVPQ